MRKPGIASQIDVKVEAAVNPSEDPQKVIDAVASVVGGCSPEFRYGSRVMGRAQGADSLSKIYEQVRSRSAMGVLRRMMLDNRAGTGTWFLLNKQAAAAGIVVVIEDEQESPLGPIRVSINCEELDALTDWLVPE
ncbi:RNA-binding domain-containing protein [Nitrososphaera sp.]|uniref:RNA-binding domain-containing protein n=1 Tax=Nitrososphaera sp. TaxID=1971748 RepID=UPI00307D6CEA